LLIGANLYLSLLSAMCMHPEDPRLEGKDLLVPRFERPLSRRTAFRAQQVVSTLALALHNILVASFIMSMVINQDTWRFPEPYMCVSLVLGWAGSGISSCHRTARSPA
jgi:hypothetical protein